MADQKSCWWGAMLVLPSSVEFTGLAVQNLGLRVYRGLGVFLRRLGGLHFRKEEAGAFARFV